MVRTDGLSLGASGMLNHQLNLCLLCIVFQLKALCLFKFPVWFEARGEIPAFKVIICTKLN